MARTITMDGVAYGAGIIAGSLRRKATIKDGPAAGYMKDYSYTRDVLGTLYDYSMDIARTGANDTEYDAFYQQITDPNVPFHAMAVPYGQSTLMFDAYIDTVSDELDLQYDAFNYWTKISVTFKARAPQRVPM